MSDSTKRSTYASGEIPGECPTPIELGNSGWNILHSAAAVYPYSPSPAQQQAMRNFIHGWSYTYACNWCAYHMRLYLKEHEPDTSNKLTITKFMCELHNNVNERLGKEQFPCDDTDKLLRRWHPGYPDNMADKPSMEERVIAEREKMRQEEHDRTQSILAQEQRLFTFGLFNKKEDRAARRPENWRASSAPTGSHPSSAVEVTPRRWWFLSNSTVNGSEKPNDMDATAEPEAPPPPAGHANRASTGAPTDRPADLRPSVSPIAPLRSGGKAADDETDVDLVLKRLKGCQVYCPEDEQVGGGVQFRR